MKDVNEGRSARGDHGCSTASVDLAAVPTTDETPKGTRCPSESTPQAPVDIRTLDGRLDRSGASPPNEPPSTAGPTGNPLYDLTLKLFPGSYFAEDGFA